MKISTWNVNSINVRLPHVLQWLEQAKPDVLALQEIKCITEKFPIEPFSELGYDVIASGQKTYNGVALLSHQAGDDVMTEFPGFDDPQRRVLAATIDGVRVINLYVPNGSSVDSDKYQYKLNWLAELKQFIMNQQKQYEKIVILGDFNIAPDDRDVHDPQEWQGSVLVSEPERQALNDVLALGFNDSFRLFEQEAEQFSWWDYRAAAFRRNRGLRIDLILASDALKADCSASDIDKEPRRWERPSDHAPASLVLN